MKRKLMILILVAPLAELPILTGPGFTSQNPLLLPQRN
jgi:hypothetical protein